MPRTIESVFVTQDVDTTFNMIEDESGDIWWGFGHRLPEEFTAEVNRWLIHACGASDPDDLFAASQPVEHLWARMDDEGGERFTVTNRLHEEDDDGIFPVTRLMI